MADWWTQDPIAPGKGLPAAPDIEVEGPGGQIFAFPAGTGQDMMREALVRHYGAPAGRPGPNAAAPAAN
ncbi:hypothetical protein ACHWGL_32115, partial [Klebsiella pneumoniae]|uniref:hypothetical protein n=1 Tax=Klebsiella pneumoniae TaxID=573 RepID=UPI00376EE8ED